MTEGTDDGDQDASYNIDLKKEKSLKSKKAPEPPARKKKLNKVDSIEQVEMVDRSRKKKRRRKNNDLEYVADPHEGVNKSAYLNMIICHSIAVADEL